MKIRLTYLRQSNNSFAHTCSRGSARILGLRGFRLAYLEQSSDSFIHTCSRRSASSLGILGFKLRYLEQATDTFSLLTPESKLLKPAATSTPRPEREEAGTTRGLKDSCSCCFPRLLESLKDAAAPINCWRKKVQKLLNLFQKTFFLFSFFLTNTHP